MKRPSKEAMSLLLQVVTLAMVVGLLVVALIAISHRNRQAAEATKKTADAARRLTQKNQLLLIHLRQVAADIDAQLAEHRRANQEAHDEQFRIHGEEPTRPEQPPPLRGEDPPPQPSPTAEESPMTEQSPFPPGPSPSPGDDLCVLAICVPAGSSEVSASNGRGSSTGWLALALVVVVAVFLIFGKRR